MDETDYCNRLNEAINNNFRTINNGDDSDVFVDERIEDGVIALTWHTHLDLFIKPDYVKSVSEFILSSFPDVHTILSPIKDFRRVSLP